MALGLLCLLGGGMLAFLISDTITRPLATLVAGVRALEGGDSHIRSKRPAETRSPKSRERLIVCASACRKRRRSRGCWRSAPAGAQDGSGGPPCGWRGARLQ